VDVLDWLSNVPGLRSQTAPRPLSRRDKLLIRHVLVLPREVERRSSASVRRSLAYIVRQLENQVLLQPPICIRPMSIPLARAH
jgi:hypothetical protein